MFRCTLLSWILLHFPVRNIGFWATCTLISRYTARSQLRVTAMAGSEIEKRVNIPSVMQSSLSMYGVERSFLEFSVVEIQSVVLLLGRALCLHQICFEQSNSDGTDNSSFTSHGPDFIDSIQFQNIQSYPRESRQKIYTASTANTHDIDSRLGKLEQQRKGI